MGLPHAGQAQQSMSYTVSTSHVPHRGLVVIISPFRSVGVARRGECRSALTAPLRTIDRGVPHARGRTTLPLCREQQCGVRRVCSSRRYVSPAASPRDMTRARTLECEPSSYERGRDACGYRLRSAVRCGVLRVRAFPFALPAPFAARPATAAATGGVAWSRSAVSRALTAVRLSTCSSEAARS